MAGADMSDDEPPQQPQSLEGPASHDHDHDYHNHRHERRGSRGHYHKPVKIDAMCCGMLGLMMCSFVFWILVLYYGAVFGVWAVSKLIEFASG